MTHGPYQSSANVRGQCGRARLGRERHAGSALLAICVVASVFLPACLDDSGDPEGESIASELPGTAIARPTASPTATASPAPELEGWLNALLTPASAAQAPSSIFFLNGPDVWLVDEELSVRQITRARRIGAVVTAPAGDRAAAVFLVSIGGREAEEVRLIDLDGQESEPVYGPEITGDPAGNPAVVVMAWSPDGSQLALGRDDGSIWKAGPEQEAAEIQEGGETGALERLCWSPDGSAVAFLTRDAEGAGQASVIPVSGDGRIDISPDQSFGDIAWLPLQARLAVTEDRGAGRNVQAGSLFTLRPDGGERELLVSAGEFGPVIGLSHLRPSPDGELLAFVVHAPDSEGELRFQALTVLELASGLRREIAVSPGLGVTDLWWTTRGLIWRAVDLRVGSAYTGVEPFAIEAHDLETGVSELIYTSDGS